MAATHLTALLIEDEERLLLGLAAIMRRAGFNVLTASNGTSGLQMATEHIPDVIVCDVMMPPPDGFQLRQLLLENSETASIPFLFLTARASQQDKLSAIEDGADDYITKPFDSQELVARVKAVLRRREIGRREGRTETEPKIDQTRRSIMTRVAREMLKPATSVLASLNRLPNQGKEESDSPTSECVAQAADSAERMRLMSRDLDLLAVLECDDQGRPSLTVDLDTDFCEPIEQCVKHWQQFEFRDIDVTLSIAPGVVVCGNPEHFQRAAYHLVDNACKFSPEGGSIHIELSQNGWGGCVLRVQDEGPGIKASQREEVFDPFFRVLSIPSSFTDGLGVGLTLVRTVARAFGGTVTIVDLPQGCTVEVVIPPSPEIWKSLAQPPSEHLIADNLMLN